MNLPFYTTGHSTRALAEFAALLTRATGVQWNHPSADKLFTDSMLAQLFSLKCQRT